MTTPREDAIAALPVLRLTGEQLDSLNADEFIIDWDEHDEFVRLSQVRAALAAEADRGTPELPEHGRCCECFDGPNMAAGHEHWGDEL